MMALQLEAAGAPLVLREVARREPGAADVLVRVAGCGVCHTDISFWRDGVPTRGALPLTLGHEVSGTVVATGEQYAQLQGRDVIVPAVIPCGHCALCEAGRGNVCRQQLMPGNDMDGGFADYICVPGRGLCVVEDTGGYALADLAVIADAVTTPYQAIVRSGLRAHDLAIVVGVGGVGTYCVQLAAALGAHVIALDVDTAKLSVIGGHGARLTLDAATELKEIRRHIAAVAYEWGCAAHSWKIFECSGQVKGQELAFNLLTHAATLLVVGFTLDRAQLRLSNLMAYDATAQGSWGCRPELYPDALRLVTSGRITLQPFIVQQPLSDGARVLERVASHGFDRRVILTPDRS